MATPTIYRWDDDGAPVMHGNATAGTLSAVMKACLVDGYGDKLPAGWSMQFEGVPGSDVVLQPASKEFAVRFYDNTAGRSNVAPADVYLDAVTASPAVWGMGVQTLYRSNSAGTGARAWVVIASPNYVMAFWSCVASSFSSVNTTFLMLGAYKDARPGMSLTNVLVAPTDTAGGVSEVFDMSDAPYTSTTNDRSCMFQRGVNGLNTVNATSGMVVTPWGVRADSSGYSSSANARPGATGAEYDPANDPIVPLGRPSMYDYVGKYRGPLPFVYLPVCRFPTDYVSGEGGTAPYTYPLALKTIEDRQFLVIQTDYSTDRYANLFLLIDLEEPWP